MNLKISTRLKAVIVGILILIAYSMLTYDFTKNIPFGAIAEFLSGIAVISISLLMYPLFIKANKQIINLFYLVARIIEGTLMVSTGIFILIPTLVSYRAFTYEYIHIYFFLLGALFFYILLYSTELVPKFISIWGITATVLLLLSALIKLFEINITILDVLLVPIVLNEMFLAFWLIIKGFNEKNI